MAQKEYQHTRKSIIMTQNAWRCRMAKRKLRCALLTSISTEAALSPEFILFLRADTVQPSFHLHHAYVMNHHQQTMSLLPPPGVLGSGVCCHLI